MYMVKEMDMDMKHEYKHVKVDEHVHTC
jgi:hypothetical protein